MQDIDDELERKYRILDDCSRLRDIVQCLPPDEKLHFVPCLVIVNWVEDDKNEKTRDFDEMLAKLLRDGIIKQILVFNIPPSATDLDGKFQQLLADCLWMSKIASRTLYRGKK
ncbi:hypothetical protein A0H81_07190 [Grifola frondosa]|uniref:Uncharacterized protein n=1 Tax=Grifola frondosa TaxID=5627 RepID=A0A1C7M8P9_GRIFR|nr:hypothetical protein A0H81_07190 [Grifola frondosa]